MLSTMSDIKAFMQFPTKSQCTLWYSVLSDELYDHTQMRYGKMS